MPQHHLDLALEDDRAALEIRLMSDDDVELFTARLEAPELDDLIHALSLARSQLADTVSPELDEGARITDTVVDPAYLVGKNTGREQALLAFRHPGLGWLGFQLRRPVVEAMLGGLRRWLDDTAQG